MNCYIDNRHNRFELRLTKNNELIGVYLTLSEAQDAANQYELGQYSQYADLKLDTTYIYSMRNLVTSAVSINRAIIASSKEMALIKINSAYPFCKVYSIKTIDEYNAVKQEVITVDFKNKKVLARA